MNGGVARVSAFFRPGCQALVAPSTVALAAGARITTAPRHSRGTSSAIEKQFESAIVDLLQLMDDSGMRGRRLHLVVSDCWVRPLLLPWQGKLPRDEEIDLVLQSQYRRTYGDLMDGWRWCWALQKERLVAAAWPAAGFKALCDGLRHRACTLVSAKPLAVDVAGKLPAELGASWLAILEQQSVTLVRRQGGVWQDWCVLPAAADIAEALPMQLARETARRQDDCRVLTLVDLHGGANIRLLRQTLDEAGWSLRVCSLNETKMSVAGRLAQAVRPGVAT